MKLERKALPHKGLRRAAGRKPKSLCYNDLR